MKARANDALKQFFMNDGRSPPAAGNHLVSLWLLAMIEWGRADLVGTDWEIAMLRIA
jgi:hypothetical protein